MKDEDETFPPVWLCILIMIIGLGLVFLAPFLKGTMKIMTWGV
jgi:hypothetical protein